MTRSEKGASGYWSDEYKKNRKGSSRGSVNKVKRKKIRDVTSNFIQSGINSVDAMPTRTFTQRYSLDMFYQDDANAHRKDKIEAFQKKEEKLEEIKEELKSEKQNDKFQEWSEGKPKKVVRKAVRKSQHEGLSHPFEDQETDSETEREINRRRSALVGEHGEIVKYLETGSGKSFKLERSYTVK